jgi:predicted ATP-grasp superfamily ATP-dependent carboligase
MQLVRKFQEFPDVERRKKVLAICGDSQVGLSMLRSLARNGLTVYAVCNSAEGQSAHSRYCSGAWVYDRGSDAKPKYEQLKELARQLQVGSVMPIAEGLHAALIEHRNEFEPDIHVFSPAAEAFAKATDKDYLHGLCLELGVPVAKGMMLDALMAAGGDDLTFPLVLRTSRQNVEGPKAPWKAAYAPNKTKLQSLFESVREFADNVIVQEYHSGVEDHVHILMHRGEPFMIGEYLGEQHAPLAGGVTVQRVSCFHPQLQQDGVKILKAIGWDGIATAQFHFDPETEEYIFLEINPRMCGGQPTVIMAGFESPFLLWQSHFEPDKMRVTPYRLGLRTRILGGCANWMFGMLGDEQLPPDQERLSKLGTVGRFLWNSGPWTKDDSFAWTDPKPFFVDVKQMFLKRLLKSGAGQSSDLA